MAFSRGFAASQKHDQIIEPHDSLATLRGNDSAVGVDAPIASRSGENQVARFGIDKHVAQALEAGEREHFDIKRLTCRLASRNLALQARQRHIAQGARLPGRSGKRRVLAWCDATLCDKVV